MAYSGYLIKVGGNYVFPLAVIEEKTYKGLISTKDVGSNEDTKGELHRKVVPKRRFKAEFTTIPMTNVQWASIYNQLYSRMIGEKAEKKVMVSIYINELDTYVQGYAYLPDIDFNIDWIEQKKNLIHYSGIRVAFIGYEAVI